MARLRRGNPALLRDLNRAAILGLIGTDGPIARVEIARRLALGGATVTDITRDLVADGLVHEVDQAPSSGGRPPILLGLVGRAAQAIGVKIALDHLALVRVSLEGDVLERWTEPFDAGSQGSIERLSDRLAAAVEATRPDAGRLLGVGLGVPGIVDPTGVVRAPMFGWADVDLARRLEPRLGVPVLADNDVNTLAVAERLYGRARGLEHVITVTIGRGVGLGIVASGDLYRGARGGAGEFGHVPVVDDGPRCECGKHGCLEALVADPALAEQALAAGIVGATDPDPVGALRVAADGGDIRALELYERAAALLGRAVGGLVNILSPQLVILSGEGTLAWAHMARGFEAALHAAVFPPLDGVTLDVDPWDDAKWARGAAALVLRATFAAPLYERQPEDAVRDRLARRDGRGASAERAKRPERGPARALSESVR